MMELHQVTSSFSRCGGKLANGSFVHVILCRAAHPFLHWLLRNLVIECYTSPYKEINNIKITHAIQTTCFNLVMLGGKRTTSSGKSKTFIYLFIYSSIRIWSWLVGRPTNSLKNLRLMYYQAERKVRRQQFKTQQLQLPTPIPILHNV